MKSLHEVVSFLRDNMIIPPGSFSVAGVPFAGFSDDLLREGVAAFHACMRDLYTFFIDNAQAYDQPLKTAKGDFPSLGQGYPVLRNTFLALYLLGVHGMPSEDGTALRVDTIALREGIRAMRITRAGDIIALLRAAGMDIAGEIAKSDALLLTCPAWPAAPLGLAAMAQASARYAKKPADKEVVTDRFMMRFDYHVLSGGKNPTAPIEECLNAAPAAVRDFLLRLNDRFVREGCKRQMTPKLFYTKCAYRPEDMRTVLFTIHANFDRYWVKLNAEHIAQYAELLRDAPEDMQVALSNEQWFCPKQHDPSACMPKCRGGFRFMLRGKECMPCRMGAFQLPMDSAPEQAFALRWIDTEVAHM